MVKNGLTAGVLASLLCGCATPEWQATHSECTKTFYRQLPPSFQLVQVTRAVPVEVLTGQTNCVSTQMAGSVTTECRPVTMTQWRSIPDFDSVDMNAEARENAINLCTKTTCLTQFGNAQCKPAPPLAPARPSPNPSAPRPGPA
ncbi:MAG: hypothetical protein ACR2IG_04170 [Roseomonas sp.]